MPRKDYSRNNPHSSNPRAKNREYGTTGGGNQFLDNLKDFFTDPGQFYEESHDPVKNAWEGEMQDETDYWFQQFLVSSPLAPIFQGKWNKDALVNYMNRYGFTWQDLISRNVMNSQFATRGINPVNFVGDMVKELYS